VEKPNSVIVYGYYNLGLQQVFIGAVDSNTQCLSFVSVHQMAPPVTEVGDIQLHLILNYGSRRDERLSWPGWLTYSGLFSHIHVSGHPLAAGLATYQQN